MHNCALQVEKLWLHHCLISRGSDVDTVDEILLVARDLLLGWAWLVDVAQWGCIGITP